MRALIATPEATPYAKTGGLADVAGSLLKEFRIRGVKASVILPLYKAVKENFRLYRTGAEFRIRLADSDMYGEVWSSEKTDCPQAYFIVCDELYGRSELYGTSGGDYPDNAARFAFFSRGILEACRALHIRPDIIHCNDWQTAMLPLYLKSLYRTTEFKRTATLYTIHNLGYQGLFQASDMRYTNLGWDYFVPEKLEFFGMLNYMKAGLIYADILNTVSSTYAREILLRENGFGLDGLLNRRKDDLYGVLNGIDYGQWDPSADQMIPESYSAKNLKGKRDCKKKLLKDVGLSDESIPLVGVISRLSSQKGIDLLVSSIDEMVAAGVNLIIFGKGENHYKNLLRDISRRHKGRVFFKVGFEEHLAHHMYAGCDFLLMPSRYEPCGLGQLIALRYGTIPIVRKTGGLVDTVKDYDHMNAKGNGFFFSDYSSPALLNAVKRALCVFVAGDKMESMMSQGMAEDFSWGRSAEKYLELYRKAMEKVRI